MAFFKLRFSFTIALSHFIGFNLPLLDFPNVNLKFRASSAQTNSVQLQNVRNPPLIPLKWSVYQNRADKKPFVSLQGDKNSIVQSAAIYIHELKVARDQLQRRNEELKAQIMGHDEQQPCVTVQFEVDEPSSSIDSMIAALRRLKGMSVKARGIRSSMSGNRLWTEMNVETTVRALSLPPPPGLQFLKIFAFFSPLNLAYLPC